MIRRQILSISAAMAACVLMPSCVTTWNFGQRMEESTITYRGVDTTKPEGGVVYKTAGNEYYMQAPEVTYKASSPMVSTKYYAQQTQTLEDTDKRSVSEVTPTGRTVCVKVRGIEKDGAFKPTYYAGAKPVLVDAIPAGCVTLPVNTKDIKPTPTVYGQHETVQDPAGKGKRLAALPLKYAADPLLDVATNAVVYSVAVPYGIVVGIPSLIKTARQNQKALYTEQ